MKKDKDIYNPLSNRRQVLLRNRNQEKHTIAIGYTMFQHMRQDMAFLHQRLV